MSNVIPFSYHNKEIRTIQDEAGNPWWVAKDICENFSDTNYRRSIARLDDDEKGVSQISTPGGKQQMVIINEPGLYSLLFYMQPEKGRGVSDESIEERKIQLKEFKRWITHEVLPTIRKTGTYQIKPEPVEVPKSLVTPAQELEAAIKIANLFGLKDNQALLSANKIVEQITGTDCMGVFQITHLDRADLEQHLIPSDIGVQLGGISARKINGLLKDLGYQESFRDKDKKLVWKPTEKGSAFAILKDTGKKKRSGTPIVQLFWKDSIVELIQAETASL